VLGWLERNRSFILFTLLNLSAVGLMLLGVQWPRRVPVSISTPTPAPLPTEPPLRVYVSGAVMSPDVYTLSPGAIAKDAVVAAGGPAADADLDRVNLAVPLRDGDQVYIPTISQEPQQEERAAPLPVPQDPTGKLNLNRATAQELEALPGIGPTLAQRIIDYRTQHGFFGSVEELTEVKGIGPAVLENVRDLVTVR
jgi:competence protein ComEA